MLRVGGYGPEKSAHGKGLAAFARHMEDATSGEISVDVTWNIMDEGRPNTDLFDLVAAGEMFFCYFSTSYLGDRVPELNVLEAPFLFPGLEEAHTSLDGALGERLREAVRERTPFEALGFWDNGFRHLTNRLRPVHQPSDCAGMRVRMQPNAIHEELIRCWGAVPVAVELSEAIQLISSGSVDAQENPLANTVAYGVEKVHSHYTMTGHLYGARGLFADRHAYQGLDEDTRSVVDAAVARAIAVQREAAAQTEADLRSRLEGDGARFVDLTTEEKDVFVAASAPAIALARSSAPASLFELVSR